MRVLCMIAAVMLLSVGLAAQIPATATPTPTPRPGTRQANPIVGDSDTFNRLGSVEMMSRGDRSASHPLLDPKKGIYRKASKDELTALQVNPSLLTTYAAFLKHPHTGIVKLNAESSCVTDADVVIATEKCLPYRMPGAGAAYSFRAETYRLPRLADVILLDGEFKTGGVYQQVAIADLGELSLDRATLASKGVAYLAALKPVPDTDEFHKLDDALLKGVEADGFSYRKAQPVKDGHTYALRSFAYRGKFIRSIDGVSYNELEYDKRRDVIVVFRAVERDPSGNITILWELLADADAPQLQIKKPN